MFEPMDGAVEARVSKEEAFNMLQELESNTPDEIRRQRAHFRITTRAKVILQPGNASELIKLKIQGVLGDLSSGGCRALFPLPLHVGDIYRLTFDQRDLPLPMTFVRCMRCVLLKEDAFECGFKFFSPVSLPENIAAD